MPPLLDWARLPWDILFTILDVLPLNDVLIASRVCTAWRRAVAARPEALLALCVQGSHWAAGSPALLLPHGKAEPLLLHHLQDSLPAAR